MNISFRRANLDDIAVIRSLAEAIWWQHYPGLITDAQIIYMLGKGYSEAAIAEQMAQKQNYTLIYDGSEAVGYYAVSEKSPHHFFLHKFYIDTTLHRSGIGTAALQYMKENDCKGFKEITLQVNRENVKAINFYFKNGFVIDYAKNFDIGEGFSMDDFMMKLVDRR